MKYFYDNKGMPDKLIGIPSWLGPKFDAALYISNQNYLLLA